MKYLNNLFRLPTHNELALQELGEAQASLIKAQSALDYATAMVGYNQNRVMRLQAYVDEQEGAFKTIKSSRDSPGL